MPIDVSRARLETPGAENVIHFNNCGAGLMPKPVVDALKDHLELEAMIGGYEAAESKAGELEATYSAIARLLNCSADEIAVMENATVGWHMAFHALARDFRPGDKIITAEAEYVSNYISYLQVARQMGVEILTVPSTDTGELSVSALEEMIDDKVRLIAVTHVPTNGGLVNPAKEIGRVANGAGIPYLLDACQSAGQLVLDVNEIGCDILTATGRKYLRGPRGTGFLYVKKAMLDNLEPPFLDLSGAEWASVDSYTVRPDARRFENWESYMAGKIGLGCAVEYALSWGLEAIQERVNMLANLLREGLSGIKGLEVRDLGKSKCGIISFTVSNVDPVELQSELRSKGINCSSSPQKYTRLDMSRRGLEMVSRAGVHYYNTEEEVHRFCYEVENFIGSNL